MKKIVIPVIIFLLILGGLIGYGIARATEYMTYTRQCSVHIIDIAQGSGQVVAEDTDGTKTILKFANADGFITAVTRADTEFILFKSGLDEMPCVKVEFPDGAKFEVFDGGKKDKDDVAYVRYTYKNKSKLFRIIGYRTFERVRLCISPGGMNGQNSIVKE